MVYKQQAYHIDEREVRNIEITCFGLPALTPYFSVNHLVVEHSDLTVQRSYQSPIRTHAHAHTERTQAATKWLKKTLSSDSCVSFSCPAPAAGRGVTRISRRTMERPRWLCGRHFILSVEDFSVEWNAWCLLWTKKDEEAKCGVLTAMV